MRVASRKGLVRSAELQPQELDWDVEADVVIAGASVAGYSPVVDLYGVGGRLTALRLQT